MQKSTHLTCKRLLTLTKQALMPSNVKGALLSGFEMLGKLLQALADKLKEGEHVDWNIGYSQSINVSFADTHKNHHLTLKDGVLCNLAFSDYKVGAVLNFHVDIGTGSTLAVLPSSSNCISNNAAEGENLVQVLCVAEPGTHGAEATLFYSINKVV